MDIPSLIAAFGGFTWFVVAFVVALSVIVAIHEYGHYIVGRWCGIHAEVFSLGFGPVLAARTDRRGTRWQIAALPFGGYVKFLGDANAASGKDGEVVSSLSLEERRRTMHGAPLWARVLTIAAGPVFNFILSFFVFAAFFMANGTAKEPLQIASLMPVPYETELQEGDVILEIDGQDARSYAAIDALEDLPREPVLPYTVERAGDVITVSGSHPSPTLATGISLESAAQDAGLRAGDVILSMNGTPVSVFAQMVEIVQEVQGAPILLEVWRDGDTFETTLTPRATDERQPGGGFQTNWRIGIQGGGFFEPVTTALGPVEAVPTAAAQVWLIIISSLDGLWNMITGAISTCNLSGPIGIAETAGTMASLGLEQFVWFIAVLSTAVGLLNLFPIPVLDGGHLVFHAYEAVSGKPPSDRALNILMTFGLMVIATLMILGLSSDLFCP
ncbi:MAG: RIP metalloprotease RseP [Pseudomonadota bacterium]